MSSYSKIFHKVPIQVPNKSGFDCSHENLLTATCGTLIPIMVDPLLPNDSISLGSTLQIQLPPMATDFYGRVQGKLEAFFVPNRILYGGWQDFITHDNGANGYPSGTDAVEKVSPLLPCLNVHKGACGAGSLSDYLGFKQVDCSGSSSSDAYVVNNPLPYIAYHKIYDDWYRDRKIQKPVFTKTAYSDEVLGAKSLPYRNDVGSRSMLNPLLNDGTSVLFLRQRNWPKDYFTNSSPSPQAGEPMSVEFDTSKDKGSFTIASLRAANSIQQWLERNNLAGYLYGDQIKARFGVYPSDAVTDRSIYLGSASVDVYTKSVYQSAGSTLNDSQSSKNPFGTVGSKYGSSSGVGQISLVDNFTASEHGFIFVMFSLVPSCYYSSGRRRYLGYSTPFDFPDPMLAGVGDQEIWQSEISDKPVHGLGSGTFGYTQRYSEAKFMDDEVHGLLRDGQSLESFCLQRSFSDVDNPITICSNFLRIPKDYLDQVTAVSADASKYGCWVDAFFKYHKSSTLPAYSIPTLGDPHDTHTEVIDNGGKRL